MTGDLGPQGVLIVDKPVGPTSHDVVGALRRILGTREVGHCGTLDPLAEGVLVVCVGACTRLVPFLTGFDKTYRATIVLGATTETDDREAEPRPGGPVPDLSAEAVEAVLRSFLPGYEQRPPAYSAKKIAGRAAHQLARAGQEVILKSVDVAVHDIALNAMTTWPKPEGIWPALDVTMNVGSGFFVRSLARDVGEKLGCGAFLGELSRESVAGPAVGSRALDWSRATAWRADGLGTGDWKSLATPERRDELLARLLSPMEALSWFPAIELDAAMTAEIEAGRRNSVPHIFAADAGDLLVLYGPEGICAVARTDEARTHAVVERRLRHARDLWVAWKSGLAHATHAAPPKPS